MICLEKPLLITFGRDFCNRFFDLLVHLLFIFIFSDFSRLKRQMVRPASSFPTLSVPNAGENLAPYLKVTYNYVCFMFATPLQARTTPDMIFWYFSGVEEIPNMSRLYLYRRQWETNVVTSLDSSSSSTW